MNTFKKFLSLVCATIYTIILSYYLNMLFIWATPYVMSLNSNVISLPLSLIYNLTSFTIIRIILGFIILLLLLFIILLALSIIGNIILFLSYFPLTQMVKSNKYAGWLSSIILVIIMITCIALPWQLDIEYSRFKVFLAVLYDIIIFLTFNFAELSILLSLDDDFTTMHKELLSFFKKS